MVEVLGDGLLTSSFLYADECILNMIQLMDSNIKAPFNIASNILLNKNELMSIIIKQSGKKLTIRNTTGYASTNNINTSIMFETYVRKIYVWVLSQVGILKRPIARHKARPIPRPIARPRPIEQQPLELFVLNTVCKICHTSLTININSNGYCRTCCGEKYDIEDNGADISTEIGTKNCIECFQSVSVNDIDVNGLCRICWDEKYRDTESDIDRDITECMAEIARLKSLSKRTQFVNDSKYTSSESLYTYIK